MRKAFCFYWLCFRRALSGSVEKANARSNILGAAIVAFVLWYFRYQLTLPESVWWQNIIVAVLYFLVAWPVVFVFRLLAAPHQLYWDEHQKAARLAPNIKVYLDPKTRGVTPIALQNTPLQKWIQITVESASVAPLVDCEVWVNKIQRVRGNEVIAELIYEPIIALWSQLDPPENRRRNIPAMVPAAANLFQVVDVDVVLARVRPQFNHVKDRLLDEIQKPGQYRIETVIGAKDCEPVKKYFLFNWSGKFKNVKISESPEAHSR